MVACAITIFVWGAKTAGSRATDKFLGWSGGGNIGTAQIPRSSQDGWQKVHSHSECTLARTGGTGCAPKDAARQRRAAQRVVEAACCGSIAMLPPADAGGADATGAAGNVRTPDVRRLTFELFASPMPLPTVALAKDVGGGIGQAAGGGIVSAVTPRLTRQVRQLHLLLIIISLPVAASYRSCRGSGSGSRSSVATLRKGLAASDRCRLAPQCAGHASDGVADPGGNSLSEGLITKIIRRFAVSALLCCVMRVMWDVRRSGEHGTRVCRPGKSAGGRWARTIRRRDKMSGSSQGVAAESSRRKAQVHSRRRGRGTCDSSREKLFHPYAVKGGKSCHHLNLFLVQRMRWMRSGPNGRNG